MPSGRNQAAANHCFFSSGFCSAAGAAGAAGAAASAAGAAGAAAGAGSAAGAGAATGAGAGAGASSFLPQAVRAAAAANRPAINRFLFMVSPNGEGELTTEAGAPNKGNGAEIRPSRSISSLFQKMSSMETLIGFPPEFASNCVQQGLRFTTPTWWRGTRVWTWPTNHAIPAERPFCAGGCRWQPPRHVQGQGASSRLWGSTCLAGNHRAAPQDRPGHQNNGPTAPATEQNGHGAGAPIGNRGRACANAAPDPPTAPAIR